MVAKIITGKSIRGILHYNENKVAEGTAALILASGFAIDVEKMNFHNKLRRFQHLNKLKPSIKTNAFHISLNFDANEKLDNTKMQQIAIAYMDRLGFSDQPFLVYRHNDAAHQHLHIATTSIQRDGTSINLHNIGRDRSEPARKAIEKEFDLIAAESRKYSPKPGIKPADPERIKYGKIPTKRAIGNVVTAVMGTYRFTSLAEYNAVLKQFNVRSDRGKEDTEMFRKKGLIYVLLDSKGNKVGVPIKASAFYCKPTLRNLEKKFGKNQQMRKPFKRNLIDQINKVFERYDSITRNTFTTELGKGGIVLVLRRNKQGLIYGTTFIDHQSKTVFNGSDLGRVYSAKELTGRFGNTDQLKTYLRPILTQATYLQIDKPETNHLTPIKPTSYLKGLLDKPHANDEPMIPKKKKKRKRGLTI